jgi:hypothetical protein
VEEILHEAGSRRPRPGLGGDAADKKNADGEPASSCSARTARNGTSRAAADVRRELDALIALDDRRVRVIVLNGVNLNMLGRRDLPSTAASRWPARSASTRGPASSSSPSSAARRTAR